MSNNAYELGMNEYFKLISSNTSLIILAVVCVLIIGLLIFLYFKKKYKLLMMITLSIASIFLIGAWIMYYSILLEALDNFVQSVVNIMVFPKVSFLIYLFVFFLVFSALFGIFDKKTKHVKLLNGIFISLFSLIFISLSIVMVKYKLDFNEGILLYKNNLFLFLMQTYIRVFLVWIVAFIVVFCYDLIVGKE